MRFLSACLFLLAIVPSQIFALEPQCFTEYAEFTHTGSLPIFVSTEERSDLFFTQNQNLIPTRIKPLIVRSSYPYTLSANIGTFPLRDAPFLLDDLPETQIEVDPFMAPQGFSITLDFGKILEKYSYNPIIDMTSGNTYSEMEISRDGKTYISITGYDMESNSFRYLRITFPKGDKEQKSSFLRTIRFDNKTSPIYLLKPLNTSGAIMAYRGWICDPSRLSYLKSQRTSLSKNIDVTMEVLHPIQLQFFALPTIGRDSDGDAIIDMRDNCPDVPNPNQQDRDHDGRGDACSDDDRDGISGASDNCPTVSNPDQKDINANGIGDACEFDTDNDTIPDGSDNCIHTPNPDQGDTDSDGIGNACDNCKIYNPDQLDLNSNTIGDVCEAADEYNRVNDSDKDGILDFSDNCKHTPNPDQADTDSDGIGNACDNCALIKNPDQTDDKKNGKGDMCEDADGDKIEGWRDNCPTIANPDQKDSNNDGTGDACSDTDRDGIYDALDNCPLISNPDQKDIDNDHIGNVCDTTDNRYLESNKTIFVVLFGVIALLFIGGIIFFIRKIKL